jgi:hypothetical protein
VHQVGFSVHDYIEMHRQKTIKKTNDIVFPAIEGEIILMAFINNDFDKFDFAVLNNLILLLLITLFYIFTA